MPRRESERRYGTVMFADISDFTVMSRAMDPEELTRVMNLAFKLLEDAVTAHGGRVARYMGDAILALFGIPNALEDAPRAAVNAAIDIGHRLARLNLEHRLPIPLVAHIGINSGLMLAGNVGGAVTHEFTVMGDVVNLASRLKDASRPGKIWVGAQTHSDTRFDFEYRKLRPLRLKGIGESVTAYEVRSTTVQHRRRVRPGRWLFSEMLGRDRELDAIGRCLADLASGRGGVVSVSGEAGIGKSRLVAEALSRAAVGTRVMDARSLSTGEAVSFHPFVHMLRQWAAIADEDDEPRAVDKLATAVREVLGADADEVTPFVVTMMGLRLPGPVAERLRGIEGEALEKLIRKSFRDLLHAMALREPIVLFFEDLHWADQSSLELLRTMLPLVETSAVLLLMASRPQHAGAQRIVDEARRRMPDRHVEISLGPLEARQCVKLLRGLLKLDDRPHTTHTVILSKTEGNPFFIEEVIRSFIEEGAIEETDAGLRVTEKIESVDVPGTVHEVIMARVDRLPEDVRRVLQLASVIGRNVPERILTAVADDPRHLHRTLAYLKRAQLLDARQIGDDREYVFTHALAREAVYGSLLLSTRRELHRVIAESIESLYAERLPEYFGMLAYHFSRAQLIEKAEEYLFKAGEEAVRAAGSSEALHYFREASRLYMEMHGQAGEPRKQALLEKNIGLALLNRGDLLESVEHFDRALRLLGERVPTTRAAARWRLVADGAVLAARVSLGRTTGSARSNDREAFEIRYHRARAQTTSDPRRFFFDSIGTSRRLTETDPTVIDQACGMYTAVGAMFGWSGLPFPIAKRFLAIARTLIREGSVRDEFAYRSWTFVLHYLEGDWSEAHTVPEEFVEQALRYGQFWDVNTYRGLNCERLIHQGEFAAAEQEIARIRRLADDYGYDFARSNEYAMPALLLVQQRRLPAALAAIERYYTERDEALLNLFALGTKAKIQLYAGDPKASDTLARAETLRGELTLVPGYHASALIQGRLLHDVDALDRACRAGSRGHCALARRARRSARRAVRMSRAVARERVEAYRLAGRLWWLLGSRDRALRWWQRSMQEGERMRARPELARTWLEVGRSLTAAGWGDRLVGGIPAVAYVAQAERSFEMLGLEQDLASAKAVPGLSRALSAGSQGASPLVA